MKKIHILLTLVTIIALSFFGCEADLSSGDTESIITKGNSRSCSSTQGSSIRYGVTSHFRAWLEANGYEPAYNLVRDDLSGGSFGGKASSSDCLNNQPVIFIHGNSDRALGGSAGGWEASVQYFLSRGYRMSELYGTTWGPASASMAAYQYHSKTYVTKIRKFIQAVKAYTGADKVDVITHSMGVTLTRKAIKGGSGYDSLEGGSYYLGSSITSYVDTFVGIAGANLGLTSCYQTGGSTPTCAATNGLYPGYLWWGMVFSRSDFLDDLKSSSGYEGSKVYTIWSTVDEVIGYGCVVYGSYTTKIPGQDGQKVYSSYPYGHFGVKSQTGSVQFNMVKYHTY